MRRELAESFSLSFHPLLIPFYSLLFIFVLPIFEVQSLGAKFQTYLIVMIGLITIGLPILSMRMLKKQNAISSYYLEKREERNVPYLLILVYYGITTFMLFRIDFLPLVIPLIYVITSAGTFIIMLLNLRLKVSAHSMAMGSLNSIVFLMHHFYDLHLEIPMTVIMLLSIIVILSRHHLKAHNWTELIIGYFVGIFISLAIGFYLLNSILG
jgi:membrane-associated phospholipid phosphatase